MFYCSYVDSMQLVAFILDNLKSRIIIINFETNCNELGNS